MRDAVQVIGWDRTEMLGIPREGVLTLFYSHRETSVVSKQGTTWSALEKLTGLHHTGCVGCGWRAGLLSEVTTSAGEEK